LWDYTKPGPLEIPAYITADLPAASEWCDNATYSSLVYVIDDTNDDSFVSDIPDGPCLAFSDGTNWRRVTDRSIVV